jgi:hypothetical protein
LCLGERRKEVSNDEVCVGIILFLFVILSQKGKVMRAYHCSGMPRDNNTLRKPFIEDITIK